MNWHETQAKKAKRKKERAGRASRMVREARKAAKLEAERQERMDALALPPMIVPPTPALLDLARTSGKSQEQLEQLGVAVATPDLAAPAGEKNLHFDHPTQAIAAAIATVGPQYRVRKIKVDGAIQLVIDNPKTGTRVVVCGRR